RCSRKSSSVKNHSCMARLWTLATTSTPSQERGREGRFPSSTRSSRRCTLPHAVPLELRGHSMPGQAKQHMHCVVARSNLSWLGRSSTARKQPCLGSGTAAHVLCCCWADTAFSPGKRSIAVRARRKQHKGPLKPLPALIALSPESYRWCTSRHSNARTLPQ